MMSKQSSLHASGSVPQLVVDLQGQFAETAKLEPAIKANLRRLGFK
jgi:hypothetical protein